MVVGGSNDGGSASDPRVSKRDYNRDTSRSNADRSSGYWNSKSTSWGDKDFMRDLGREGVQRQQEAMSQAADDEDARVQRRQPARVVKRTPPRTAGRK